MNQFVLVDGFGELHHFAAIRLVRVRELSAFRTNLASVATGLSSIDPCIGLRTKQVATLRTYLTSLGWTTAQINAIGMSDADVAIVIRKGSPWDAKVGVH